MKKLLTSILIIASVNTLYAQSTINLERAKIIYCIPDSSDWQITVDNTNVDSVGMRWFRRKPIPEETKYPNGTILFITYHCNVANIKDVSEYSSSQLRMTYGNLDCKIELLGGYPNYSSDKHSVVSKIECRKDGDIFVGFIEYIFYKNIGVEIMVSSTEQIFKKYEKEMLQFIKSVQLVFNSRRQPNQALKLTE